MTQSMGLPTHHVVIMMCYPHDSSRIYTRAASATMVRSFVVVPFTAHVANCLRQWAVGSHDITIHKLYFTVLATEHLACRCLTVS